jgi:hypothetical protein
MFFPVAIHGIIGEIPLYNFCTNGIIMGLKKKLKKEQQLIMDAFINVIKENTNPPDSGGSVSEELARGFGKKRD